MMVELRRLLLVEDSAEDAELTLTALQASMLANRIDWVRDGEEALEYLERRGRHARRPEGNPCVVLLDLKLPKVDGLQVLAFVKKSGPLRAIPVVVLTSSRHDRDLQDAYRLGVNAYVVKPVDFRSFSEAVRTLGLFWAVVNEPPPTPGATPPAPRS